MRMFVAALATAGAVLGLATANGVVMLANRTERAALGQIVPAAPVGAEAGWQSVLRRSALDANALWAGAVQMERTDPARAATLATLASRMTRRHFPSQAWLLEQDIARGSVTATLQQYDILITVWPAGRPRLISQLVLVARQDPNVARALLAFSLRPWYGAFLAEAARQDGGRFIAHLRQYADHLSDTAGAAEQVAYLTALIANGHALAAAAHVLADPAVPDALVTDFAPTAQTTDPRWGALAWALASTPEAAATMAAGARGIRLEADGDATATLLTRTTLLKAGLYRMHLAFRIDPSNDAPLIGWTVTCNQDQQPIASGDIDPNNTPDRIFTLKLPAPCESQHWAISATEKYGSRSSVTLSTLALEADGPPGGPSSPRAPAAALN